MPTVVAVLIHQSALQDLAEEQLVAVWAGHVLRYLRKARRCEAPRRRERAGPCGCRWRRRRGHGPRWGGAGVGRRRRVGRAIDFEEPTVDERRALWPCHLPERAPLDADVDLDQSAALYPIVGGIVRNAATAAGFIAASEDVPINRRHLGGALRREYEKAGRAFPGDPTDEDHSAGPMANDTLLLVANDAQTAAQTEFDRVAGDLRQAQADIGTAQHALEGR